MEVPRLEDLDPEQQRTLRLLRAQVAEQGYELTPEQMLDLYKETMEHLDAMLEKEGWGIKAFTTNFSRWQYISEIPSRPPYYFLFDYREEAENFAERAKAYHEADCVIETVRVPSLCIHRTYYLLTDLETHLEFRKEELETDLNERLGQDESETKAQEDQTEDPT